MLIIILYLIVPNYWLYDFSSFLLFSFPCSICVRTMFNVWINVCSVLFCWYDLAAREYNSATCMIEQGVWSCILFLDYLEKYKTEIILLGTCKRLSINTCSGIDMIVQRRILPMYMFFLILVRYLYDSVLMSL